MTLKEKFKNADERYFDEALIETNIKIADDFAIGFAEWMRQNTIYNGSEYYVYIDDSQQYKLNKLLEIYKKEKGL